MFYFGVLIACLASLPRGQGEPRAGARRYKPIIQVTEEIDINDITFTTSVPEFASRKAVPEGGKQEKVVYGRHADASPSISYGASVPLEIYSTGQPLVVPPVKYKSYKVFKVQDGFGPAGYKPKVQEKGRLSFDALPTFGAETKYAKVLPFSGQLQARGPARAPAGFVVSENKNFIPSPTFSPTVLAQINNENTPKFSEPDIQSFSPQSTTTWQKPSKKPHHSKTANIPDNHQSTVGAEDFAATSEKLQENLTPSTLYRESPQQSGSLLSEISSLHKGGSGANNLDGVADSLDLKTGERVEFQMYGMDGPQSYKFGFDTGKGQNRHFRFEERDNTGKVKGHYGYLDEEGKMRIMKYEADPVTGFHAGPVELSPDEN